MTPPQKSEYYLLWKGCQTGPYPLAAIREKLASGEISRMHQVGVEGRWMVVGEFLEQQDRGAMEARRQNGEAQRLAEVAQREEQLRRDYEAQLAAERAQQSALQNRLAEAEKRSTLAHLLPPPPPLESQPPPPIYAPGPGYPPPPDYVPPPGYLDPYASSDPPPGPTRTSGLAVAAFIMAICNFIPYVNFVTWLLAIIFGHIALSHIKRDSTLGGRGLALAGLIITYVLIAIGFIVGLVYGLVAGHALHL